MSQEETALLCPCLAACEDPGGQLLPREDGGSQTLPPVWKQSWAGVASLDASFLAHMRAPPKLRENSLQGL